MTRDATAAQARWAITAVFGANGLLIASLVARMPSLKLDLELSTGQLGLVSAMFGAAALLGMHGAGRLASRVGSRPIVQFVILLLPLALVGIGLADGIGSLIAFQLLFGAAQGTLDVTMNAHAVAIERALHRHIMNGCHAAWSIGAVIGALAGSVAAQAGTARWLHYLVIACLLLPLAAIAGAYLLPADVDRSAAQTRTQPARPRSRPPWTPRVLVYGAMGATVLTAEAAVANWSGVFLHESVGAPLGVAALGYLAFSGCQTAGRLVGDRLLARRSPARLVRLGTVCAAVGFAVAVLAPWPALGIVGFAVVGVGLATPLPVLFAVVGHLGGVRAGSAVTVARFASITFTGLLVAPAVIGWVAELVGLGWTLAALIPLLLAVATAADTARVPHALGTEPLSPAPHSTPMNAPCEAAEGR